MTFFVKKIIFCEHIFFAQNRSMRWVSAQHCRDYKMHTYLDVYTCEKKNINACCLKRSFIFITKIVHVRLFTMKSIFERKRCTFDTPKTFYSFWKKSTYCILCTETSYNLQADINFRKQSVSRIKIVNNVFLNSYIVCSRVGSLHWLINETRVQKLINTNK